MKSLVFFGTEDYSLITLRHLVEAGYNFSAVVTKSDSKRGRGQKLTEPPVKTYAKQQGITVWQPDKLREISDNLTALQPLAGVLVAYGKIIPQSILDLFEPGIINVHPSLLPLWRGPSPIEAAISNRDSQTGVTIMKLEAGMDSGPIYVQQSISLNMSETKPELYDKLFTLGSQMISNVLADILSGKLQPTEQNHQKATYCDLLTKEDSIINPTQISAVEAEAQIRAHLGSPKTRITISGNQLIILQAHVSGQSKSPLSIKCSDDNYLVIDEIIAPSGKTMSAEAYLRGYMAGV